MVLQNDLKKFYEPESVAVIGASTEEKKPGFGVVQNILDNEFPGKIYLVNPKGGRILGMECYSSVRELPDGIDVAVIILPARLNPQAVSDCADKGIRHIVLAAGGFSEVDQAGEELQEDLRRVIAEKGVRVLGPNTSGHISTPYNFTTSFFPSPYSN